MKIKFFHDEYEDWYKEVFLHVFVITVSEKFLRVVPKRENT